MPALAPLPISPAIFVSGVLDYSDTGGITACGSELRAAAPVEDLVAVLRCEDAYAALVAEVPPGPLPGAVAEVGWLLEELRVSLFAQTLGTAVPVSPARIERELARLT